MYTSMTKAIELRGPKGSESWALCNLEMLLLNLAIARKQTEIIATAPAMPNQRFFTNTFMNISMLIDTRKDIHSQ